MNTDFFAWFQFGALVSWGVIGLTRAFLFHARGISVIAADRQRTPTEMAMELLAAACLVVWAYEVVACAWAIPFHIGPAFLHEPLITSIAVKTLGAALVSIALLFYAVALQHLGASWRLGIDNSEPGPLISHGVYRRTRHPIYLAFDLIFLGSFLTLGRPIFLLLAAIWIPMIHRLMLREERFLGQRYGDAYRDYANRVRRYF